MPATAILMFPWQILLLQISDREKCYEANKRIVFSLLLGGAFAPPLYV